MIRETFTIKTFATFRQSDAAKFRDELLKSGLAASTVRIKLSLISSLDNTANREWGISCVNPIREISKPKVDNARTKRLSVIEEKYLLAALANTGAGVRQNKYAYGVVRFAIETATRRGESLSLLRENISKAERVATALNTKNGDDRDIPLSTTAIQILFGETDSKVSKINRGKVFSTSGSAIGQCYSRALNLKTAVASIQTRYKSGGLWHCQL